MTNIPIKTFSFILFCFFTSSLLAHSQPPCFSAGQVVGAILQKYNQLGACNSFLGRPLTQELPTPDNRGRYNHFQHGSIFWTPQTGAHEVHGAIRDLWQKPGVGAQLGYPTSDELSGANGLKYSNFEGGRICWTAQRGAWIELANQAATPLPRTAENDLIVYYNGETAQNILYVKNSSGGIQAKRMQLINGRMAAHFTLSRNGGNYQILRDACGKADCLEPVYQRIGSVRLNKGQDKEVSF